MESPVVLDSGLRCNVDVLPRVLSDCCGARIGQLHNTSTDPLMEGEIICLTCQHKCKLGRYI